MIAGIATRQEVAKEAQSWIGTPYHLRGMVKGAGADCATFIYMVFKSCGLIPKDDQFSERYSHDWFCNTKNEWYLMHAMRYGWKVAESHCTRRATALPGDMVLTRCVKSPLYNHGGIVISWPHVVHAVVPEVEQCCVMDHRLWAYKDIAIFNPWERPC
jgi:cell wall-associated NlpC family hydrolase